MTRPKRPAVGPIGPDIDLDVEEVHLKTGERLTEARAAELAEEMLTEYRRQAGRPSITGTREHTPSLTVRVPPRTRKALEAIAATQGRRLADVSRDALNEYVRRHAG